MTSEPGSPAAQVLCPSCKGHGVLPAGRFSPRNERPCDQPGCDDGLVDATELDPED